MPLAPTTNMGLVLPVEDSAADSGDWDRLLNDAFERIDIHNHTTGLGLPVPSAGLNINADLTFASFRATNVAGLTLTALAGVLAAASREVFSFGGNLYYRNASNQNVRITSGATIDAASIGGIVGDYASIGAEAAYVDATDTYTFKQELAAAVRQWARGAFGSVDLYEYRAAGDATGITNRVRQSSPAGLAASYEVTWPAAVPASQVSLQMTAAGALVASNTFPTAATFSGLITASAGVTAAANQHMTVSGTGRHKHGDMTITLLPTGGFQSAAGGSYDGTGHVSAALVSQIAIPLPAGKRIRSIAFTHDRGGAGTQDFTLSRRTGDGAGANFANLATVSVAAGTGYTTANLSAIDHTMASGWVYFVTVSHNNAANITSLIEITYDHP